MKLAFTTYEIGMTQHYTELYDFAKKGGYAGLEFRIGNVHKHGIELDMTKEERIAARRKAEDMYLEISCLNTPYEFHKSGEELRASIDGAKASATLANDLGCKRIRLFGNIIPQGANAQETVENVAAAIKEVAEFAAPLGVDCLLEMHGQFNFWGYCVPVVEKINMDNVGLMYNCDHRDPCGPSIRETFSRVRKYIRHVHLKDLESNFPFLQLFEELVKMGYENFVSAEIKASSDPGRVLALNAIAVRNYIELAKYTAR
jgi:sugar phosphate isomerase/epimerase